jgi:CRISPR-associated protein Cas1
MRVLNTVYVTEHGARVGYRRGSITVSSRGERSGKRVPINGVDGVVLTGRAQPSAELLSECSRRRIRLAAVGRTGRLRFVVGGPQEGNVHLRLAQQRFTQDPSAVAAFARTFVAGKLQNCRRLLLRWSRESPDDRVRLFERHRYALEERLRSLPGTGDGDKIRGIEGDGTRRYFRGLALHMGHRSPDFAFYGRTRRPPRDPLNAALSYTYGLLLVEVAGALEAVGLDPQIGYLHGVRSGRSSLALDVLEEFRPALGDRFVVRSINRGQLRSEHFTMAPGGSCYLDDEGRKTLIDHYEAFKSEEIRHPLLDQVMPRAQLVHVQATLLARAIRGDLATYPPYIIES